MTAPEIVRLIKILTPVVLVVAGVVYLLLLLPPIVAWILAAVVVVVIVGGLVWLFATSEKAITERMAYSPEGDAALQRLVEELRSEVPTASHEIEKIEGIWEFGYPKVVVHFPTDRAVEHARADGLIDRMAARVGEAVRGDPAFGEYRERFDSEQGVWAVSPETLRFDPDAEPVSAPAPEPPADASLEAGEARPDDGPRPCDGCRRPRSREQLGPMKSTPLTLLGGLGFFGVQREEAAKLYCLRCRWTQAIFAWALVLLGLFVLIWRLL